MHHNIYSFTHTHTHADSASTPVARRRTDSATLLLHDASSSHHDTSYFHTSYFHTAAAVSSHQPPPSQYLQFHTHTRRNSLHSGRPPTYRFSLSPPPRRVVVASRRVLLPHRHRGLVAPTSSAAGFVIDFSTRVRMQHKIQPPLRSPADIPIQPLSSSTTRRRRITTRLTSTPPPRSRRTNLLSRRTRDDHDRSRLHNDHHFIAIVGICPGPATTPPLCSCCFC